MIPTPVATHGRYAPPNITRQAIYDGTALPSFLLKNGGNPHHMRKFLWCNRIGDPFALSHGHAVQVEVEAATIKKHSEA